MRDGQAGLGHPPWRGGGRGCGESRRLDRRIARVCWLSVGSKGMEHDMETIIKLGIVRRCYRQPFYVPYSGPHTLNPDSSFIPY